MDKGRSQSPGPGRELTAASLYCNRRRWRGGAFLSLTSSGRHISWRAQANGVSVWRLKRRKMAPEEASSRAFRVESERAGERLDRFLAAETSATGAGLSRTRLKALIEAGAVTVDGAPVADANFSVRAGQIVSLEIPAADRGRARRRGYSAQRRLRGRASPRHRQAGRACRPSGGGTSDRARWSMR